MKRFLITLLSALSFICASAQMHMEIGGGVSQDNYMRSRLNIGWDFDGAPVTLGISHSAWTQWEDCFRSVPFNTVGIFTRLYTGKNPFRLSVDINGDVTFASGYYREHKAIERGISCQPAIEYHIGNMFGFRLGLFRLGWWKTDTDCELLTDQSWFKWNVIDLSLIIRLGI